LLDICITTIAYALRKIIADVSIRTGQLIIALNRSTELLFRLAGIYAQGAG
jgi:hypothetical protein